MYDAGSVHSKRANNHRTAALFYPVEEYKELGLRDILSLSEECLFSDEEDMQPVTPITPMSDSTPSMVVSEGPGSAFSCEDLEWSQLDDPPIESGADDIPVAAVLVNSMELTSRKKRCRDIFLPDSDDEEASDESASDKEDEDRRFRPYQEGQWSEKFDELCDYRKENGNCLVPHTYKENLSLARWVKRQRYQHKLMKDGKPSTMTEERAKALEEIGFVWDSQAAAWGERLSELRLYRSKFLHCNVPSNYSENPQLATWVKCQRRQYKLFMERKSSNMTPQRIRELGTLGFEWELRSYKKQRTE